MNHHIVQKRQRALSDTETEVGTGNPAKRVQSSSAQSTVSVGHATAEDHGRILNGHVHGSNIHGNSSTIINNYHAGTSESSKLAGTTESSGILSPSERNELLERLRFPQLDARLSNLRKAQARTCTWIKQRKDYRTWLQSDDLKDCDGFFWIKGNPGTGKSITMKFLYQGLQNQLRNAKAKEKMEHKLVISFFFNARGNEFEKSTLGLYRSLLFNLFNLEPNVQEALDHCQRSGYHNICESGWQLQMLKEVFEEAVTLLQAQGKQLYCYIDALDECPEDDAQDMISYFEDLVSNTNSGYFRVCFSSRHYPQISIRTRFSITLEKELEHNEDIKIFIESQLRFEEDVDLELLQQIRCDILQKSSGIFLWVNLVVHQLNEVHRQDGRMKAVQQRLQNIPSAVMKRPAPNGAMPLYALFEDIIEKDDKRIDELVRITQIIFCARRPLHPRELHVLLNQQYTEPFDSNEAPDKFIAKHILEVSKGLADVTRSANPTVQFIHETVREFLRDGGLKSISTQSIDRGGHDLLMASCLAQIHAPLTEHLEVLAVYRQRPDYRDIRSHEATKERRNDFLAQADAKFPFLEYASKNLLFHAEDLEAMGVSQNQFLESFPIEEWIPIHNLFEAFNKRRYAKSTTPTLYILAGYGCSHLIKSSAEFRGQYAREITGNEFSTALTCAIINGHLETAWTLVGLETRRPPRGVEALSRASDWSKLSSLTPLLQQLGDLPLMRKFLEDQYAKTGTVWTTYVEQCKSADMIDLLLEVSNVPGFPSVGYRPQYSQADQEALAPPRSERGLYFVRRAIDKDPSLLDSRAWGGETMFEFSFSRRLHPLVSLFLEYSPKGQSVLDARLHREAAHGDLDAVTFAHRCNANLAFQDKNGLSALHLAAKAFVTYVDESRTMATVRYLLSEEPSCINLRDRYGQNVLEYCFKLSESKGTPDSLGSLLQIFPGVAINSDSYMFPCQTCGSHETHKVPLVTFMVLNRDFTSFMELISYDRCNVNARDSWGRTPLSWCFSSRHGKIPDSEGGCPKRIGLMLLKQRAVDVNSRDNHGHTILEHFIRYPFPYPDYNKDFIVEFFQSERLDPNIQVSDGQHPLDLIVSLYNTWPAERGKTYTGFFDIHTQVLEISGRKRFNDHLIQALSLLLGTGKVEIAAQRRCVGKAAPELNGIISRCIESIS